MNPIQKDMCHMFVTPCANSLHVGFNWNAMEATFLESAGDRENQHALEALKRSYFKNDGILCTQGGSGLQRPGKHDRMTWAHSLSATRTTDGATARRNTHGHKSSAMEPKVRQHH